METVPTTREELERKTLEYLETQVNRAEQGRLQKAHLYVIGKALWNITSGLVDDSVSNLCAITADSGEPPMMTRQFIGKGRVVLVKWNPNTTGFVAYTIDANTIEKKVLAVSKAEIGEREEKLETLFASLAKSGYSQLN